MNLPNKVALVTGSTSGIGLGIARTLAAAGADVLLNGFGDPALIEKLLADLKSQYRVRAAYSPADMSKPAEIAGMVAQAARELGGVDILVNNAGIQHVSPVDEFPVEKWDAVIAINLSAAFHAIRAALPHMKSKNWGRIINIASTHGLVGLAQRSAYGIAKAGVLHLTRMLAIEWAAHGIRVNAIAPGRIETESRAASNGDPQYREWATARVPLRRFGTADEVAAAACYLASPGAAYVTGQALILDGGLTSY